MSPVPKSLPAIACPKQLPPTNPFKTFPVNVGTNASAQPWAITPFADLVLISKAANESSLDSPYFEQILRQWAMQFQTNYESYTVLKVVLDP